MSPVATSEFYYSNSTTTPPSTAATSDIYISGDYAYLATGGAGLITVNISDPSNPTTGGASTSTAAAYGVTVSGNYAYLVSTDLGLEVFDVSDPTSPISLGTDYSDVLYDSQKIITSGNYAYLAANGLGFRVLDITNPSSVSLLSTTQFEGIAMQPTIVDHYLYLNDADSGIRIYDISDTLNPQLVKVYQSSGSPVAFNDSYGLVDAGQTDTYGVVEILDLSDLENPTYVGEIHTDYNPWNIALSGHYAYVTDQSGLYIYDLTSYSDTVTPAHPDMVASMSSIIGIHHIANNILYGSSEDNDVNIVDISDPTDPTIYGSYDHDNIDNILGFDVSGNYAFMNTSNSVSGTVHYSFKVLDISDLSNPTLVTTYDYDDEVIALDVVNDYAYVSGDNPGVQMFDISDPENPELIATNDDFDELYNMTVNTDGVIYIGSNGLYIYTADLDGDGEVDDHSEVRSVKGKSSGYIRINFGNGDYRRMQLFPDAGKNPVKIKQYKNTDYYIALHPKGQKIVLVNTLTGEIASTRTLTTKNYNKKQAIKIARARGKNVVIVISKDQNKKILVSILQILPNKHILRKKDQETSSKVGVYITKAKINNNKLYLRNKNLTKLRKYNINKNLKLTPKAL